MKYLLVLLLIGGMTGDRPRPDIQTTDPLPSEDVAYSKAPVLKYDCTKFLEDMRALKCHGLSVFEVAKELINMGFCDPYSGDRCGVEMRRLDRGDPGGRVFSPEPVPRDKRGRVITGDTPRRRGNYIPLRSTGGGAETTTDSADAVKDSLFESCWRNFLRYMGVKNWRNVPVDGPYPPTPQPGILHPISNLQFIPNSRWENFKCDVPEGKPIIADRPGRKRRYLGTEGFILEEEKRGKGEDQKYQDIVDYIDSRLAELDGGIEEQDIQSQMRTSYQTRTGLVDNQGTYRQGLHGSNDTITLSSGEAIVDISTQVSPGRMDRSFLNSQSYGGYAYTLDTTNTATYQLVPITGKRFKIISSDSTDTATVHFRVEGD